MTDRYNTITVVLKKDVRVDDATDLIRAIGQLRGVLSVEGNVSDPVAHMAETRARAELGFKLWETLYSKEPK